jgi:hypothetical protein
MCLLYCVSYASHTCLLVYVMFPLFKKNFKPITVQYSTVPRSVIFGVKNVKNNFVSFYNFFRAPNPFLKHTDPDFLNPF